MEIIMFKKAFLSFVLILCVICGSVVFTGASGETLSIYVNGTEIASDVSPYAKNNTTLVPVRAICNAIGIDNILWDNDSKSVTVKGTSYIQFTVGQSYAYKDGKRYSLSVPTEIKNGRTMIPLRFLAEAFGADVSWDSVYNCVDIYKQGITVPQSCRKNDYSKEEFEWLARIVSAESAGEPFSGQVAVANVVLNRVKSAEYPDTIYGVVFDTKHGTQFQPVANGTVYNVPSKTSVEAAKRAIMGENYVGDCLYFLNESTATNNWIVKNREYYTTINNHSFYV